MQGLSLRGNNIQVRFGHLFTLGTGVFMSFGETQDKMLTAGNTQRVEILGFCAA